MTQFPEASYILTPPRAEKDWAAYHAIRRDAIFAVHLPGRIYRADHPDEFKPGHLPHVLLRDGQVVGTVRIDLLDENRAAFRLIGIRQDLQRRGLGRILMRLAEEAVLGLGRRQIVVNSTPDALSFYLSLGYAAGPWQDVEPAHENLVLIGKQLPA